MMAWFEDMEEYLEYDAEKTNNFISTLQHEQRKYAVKTDALYNALNRYCNNDTFVGESADTTKRYIHLVWKKYVENIDTLQKSIYKQYCDMADNFSKTVDSSPKARIKIPVLKKVRSDYREMYDSLEYHGRNIMSIAQDLQDRFGKYGEVTQPNYHRAMDVFDEFCGTGGFLDKCIKKMVEFDDYCANAIDKSGLKDRADNAVDRLFNSKYALSSMTVYDPSVEKTTVTMAALQAGAIKIPWLKGHLPIKFAALGTSIAISSNAAIAQNSISISSEIKTLMKQYGYTKQEAELINKAINALDDASLLITKNPYKRIEHIYGTLSALCISYNSTRWQLTTGQKTTRGAILDLKFAGMSEQEILDLQVIINLQHGNFSNEKLQSNGIDVYKSSFSNETHANMVNRMNGDTNDFAHSIVQLAAFAHGDDMYKNKNINPGRWIVDLFNSTTDSQFNSTMTRYEISFKGDIDSGRYSEEDFKSDIDAINIYNRMIEKSDVGLETWKSYYDDVNNNSKVRANEFFENMGNGDAEIGIINTSKVIEADTYGSVYIKEGNETDIDKAKSTFMQWLMSVYQGVEYDFPEEN